MASGTHGQAGSGGMKGGNGPKGASTTGSGLSRHDVGARSTETQSKSGGGKLAELPRSQGIINQTPNKPGGGAPPMMGKFVSGPRATEGHTSKDFGGGLTDPAMGSPTKAFGGTDSATS